jgi:hypothetical protein
MEHGSNRTTGLTERIADQLKAGGSENIKQFKLAFSGYESQRLREIFQYLSNTSGNENAAK